MIGAAWVALFLSCYDGDTCKFDVEIWLDVWTRTNVRIAGIDAPEIVGKCPAEKALAISARDFLAATLRSGAELLIADVQPDKYGGRVLADVYVDGRSVADTMIEAGFARAYWGGTRLGWCE